MSSRECTHFCRSVAYREGRWTTSTPCISSFTHLFLKEVTHVLADRIKIATDDGRERHLGPSAAAHRVEKTVRGTVRTDPQIGAPPEPNERTPVVMWNGGVEQNQRIPYLCAVFSNRRQQLAQIPHVLAGGHPGEKPVAGYAADSAYRPSSMRAYAGTLFSWYVPRSPSDVAVKQMILAIDEHTPCIVMDLDETHVLVNTSMVETLQGLLEAEVRALLNPVRKEYVHARYVDSRQVCGNYGITLQCSISCGVSLTFCRWRRRLPFAGSRHRDAPT